VTKLFYHLNIAELQNKLDETPKSSLSFILVCSMVATRAGLELLTSL